MSKKISLGVAATIAIIAMAVTFSLTMVVSMKMFNTTVSSVKNKERQYNKLSEIDRIVRAGEYFTIDEDTLNDRLAAGYMNGINDKYAVYYTAKEYSEKQSVEKGTLTGIGVAVVNDTSSGYARIIRLYDNSPAAEAGMQVGGFITAINDESTRNITSTAGSAELFANALRKMAGATLVGTKTAGKGVVLSDAQSFSDGSAAYITVGLLLDNEDQTWNEEGLRPDIDAALSVDEQNAYYDYTLDTDPQISKAVNAATALAGQN